MSKVESRRKGSEDRGELQEPSLKAVREEIDHIDRAVLQLLAERRKKSLQAAHAKESQSDSFRDEVREEALLVARIQAGREVGLDSHYVTGIFRDILDDSLRVQQEHFQEKANVNTAALRVTFQGVEGAYSHLAAQKHFARRGGNVNFIGHARFKDAVDVVELGNADLAILPIENTTSGGITDVYDLLLHTELSIVGEVKLKVEHCLLGVDSAQLSDIRTICCHPQTLVQCSDFIANHPEWKIEYFSDTALSGKKIKEEADRSQAAIASEEAARIFGLSVIARRIANQEENYTRFILVSRKAVKVDPRIPCKTSIVMMTGNDPGSLLETLLVFRNYGINLTKLESRPILGNPWEQMFYVDFDGNLADADKERALEDITRKTRFIKVLGCYPSQDLPSAQDHSSGEKV